MNDETKPVTYGPYSPVRRAGDTVYISGQVGVDPSTKQAASDVEQQTRQMLTNLQELLDANNLSQADIVKTTVFLKNMDDFKSFNVVYLEYFTEPRPARSCVEVAALPNLADNELLVEMEAVAYKPSTKVTIA